ncbi:hypothetical protein CIHG_04284 [Coccidioides immitis H538.4]|uniref:Uncharacterized protein n=2 Tax=Coccidioides immitis TaxID=5501 RepID=A0A0J8RN21_COCIT|nr:hypothetical protein CIRG_09213 [Coccidioides immitis RMSCC 2394]KMU86495.1 hypothetical protein CIHG_04284 [Coccidioides immitis H538.4]
MDEREKTIITLVTTKRSKTLQAQPPLRVIADTTFFGFWKSQRCNFGNSLWLEDPSRVQESMTRGLCNLRTLGGDPSNSRPNHGNQAQKREKNNSSHRRRTNRSASETL